jgi:Zn-dependent peptidase ImmA (M78 family)
MKKKVKFRISPDTLNANSIFVRKIPLPLSVKGFCTYQHSNYLVCINSDTNASIQQNAIAHELKHILNKDLHSKKHVSKLED